MDEFSLSVTLCSYYNRGMNIGIVGTGYVGLVTSVCLAHIGHNVIALDKRKEIIEKLSNNTPTIYEEGLATLLEEGTGENRLHFTTNFDALEHCDVIFFAIGTPALSNGSADLSQLYEAIVSILPAIEHSTVLAVRSTIPVGTMSEIRRILTENGKKNHLAFCPEFLREGIAISDFLHPQRVVIASDTAKGRTALQEVYRPLIQNQNIPSIICTSFETAELIKYASNVFLAMKITFINQIAQLAQKTNANVYQISEAMGLDSRIGAHFLQPGPGYGGSCFPKDTMAFMQTGLKYGIDMNLVEEVHKGNIAHQKFISSWILQSLNKKGIYGILNKENETKPCIAVWGLTFKANTDDVRDSAALAIVKNFIESGFTVRCYDPKGNENFIKAMANPHVSTEVSALKTLKNCCALVVLTEWKEFASIDAHKVVQNKPFYIFDTRNILDAQSYIDSGAIFYKFGIGQNTD